MKSFAGAFLGALLGARGGSYARGAWVTAFVVCWFVYSWVITHLWIVGLVAFALAGLAVVRYDRRRGGSLPIVPARRCAVYRLYDKDGVLLYVGIAYDPDERLAQHRADREKDWWFWRFEQGGFREVQWLPSREHAKALESDVIKGRTTEPRPLYNRAENTA